MLGTHACTAELGRDLIRQRQAEGIAVKRNHGGNVGGRPRVADVKADAAVKLYIARETPIPDICARLGLAQKMGGIHRYAMRNRDTGGIETV